MKRCLLLLFGLAACTPLYLPPVPDREPIPQVERLTLGNASALELSGDTLQLVVSLERVPAEGWLAVQWFAPNNRQVASDALWVGPQDEQFSRTFFLPQTVTAGEWRAVVSFGDSYVRQFIYRVSPSDE
jgi:hypothetical protein